MTARNYLIVVGIDGSEGARSALRWAIREARSRGGSVKAVHAWRWEFPELHGEHTDARQASISGAMLDREVEAVAHHAPVGVRIAGEAVHGRPDGVLTDAARTADLLVLGSHGHSRQLHQVLGSVTEACIRHATCPVVVIPATVHIGDIDDQSAPRRGRTGARRTVDLQHPAVAMDSVA
jgi:nucleotide-binding universal stress UspA family protein